MKNSSEILIAFLCLFFGVSADYLSQETVEEVTLKSGEFDKRIEEGKTVILSCPLGHVLNIKDAKWSRNKSMPDVDRYPSRDEQYDRTPELISLCTGLSSCVIRPVSNLIETIDIYVFLGGPLDSTRYHLEVRGLCDFDPYAAVGRRMAGSVEPSKELILGCNPGELIYLSFLRGAGVSVPDHKHDYCSVSHMKARYKDCHMKNSCVIPSSDLKGDVCAYSSIEFEYFCRRNTKNAFFDAVDVDKKTFVLTAEEDSTVSLKAPALSVLDVKSATWETPGESYFQNIMRNRLDTVKFLCQGRSSCSFRPRRTACGPTDSMVDDIPFGGIAKDPKGRFILRAEFGIVDAASATVELKDSKEVKYLGVGQIELGCEADTVPMVVTALWGGTASETDKGDPGSYGALTENGVQQRYVEVGSYISAVCYRAQKCKFSPFRSSTGSGSGSGYAPIFPLVPGVSSAAHTLKVKYVCRDISKMPSLVSDDLDFAALLKSSAVEPGEGHIPKEFVKLFSFKSDSLLAIVLGVNRETQITVGGFMKVTIPYSKGGILKAELTQDHDVHSKHEVETLADEYVLMLEFVDLDYIHLTVNAFGAEGAPKVYTDKLISSSKKLDFTKGVSDVVVAEGGVSMRVFYKLR